MLRRRGQQALGFEAPSGRQVVVTSGALWGRMRRVLMAEVEPARATTTRMDEPTLRGFLINGESETLPEAAPVFLKDLAEQCFGQVAVTVAPRGTPLTTSDVSLVCCFVEFAKAKASVTTIGGSGACLAVD